MNIKYYTGNNSNEMDFEKIKSLLEKKHDEYNRSEFIENDPISIPHSFSDQRDIEITALWTAILSWGQRKTIINKAKELYSLMDNTPYNFIMNANTKEYLRFEKFVHRTFQPDDSFYFIDFFKRHYSEYESLEDAFLPKNSTGFLMKESLIGFQKHFFNSENLLNRTKKHISSPVTKSTCKRILMFLRWMVRSDENGVDFGLWKRISPSDLMIPFDVHVERISRQLGLVQRKQKDWNTVEELTNTLRKFDPKDPIKYDYALFGMGLEGRT